MFRLITTAHVQGKKKAIFATDRTSRPLQLYRVVVLYGAVASDGLYGGKKLRQSVGIEIVTGVGVQLENNG